MQPYISRFDDLNNGKRFNACRCITKLLTNPKNPKQESRKLCGNTAIISRSKGELKSLFCAGKEHHKFKQKIKNQIYTTLVVHVHSLFKDQRKYGFFLAVYGYFFFKENMPLKLAWFEEIDLTL